MSSNLNLNKIAASILLAGLIGMVAGKATEFLYDGGPQHAGGHHDEPRGYTIDVPDEPAAGGAAAPAQAADISALYPQADVAAGESYFQKKCAVCHNIDKGAPNKVGPHLYGVMGRKVASIGDFSYSQAMKGHGDRSWSWDEMNHFQWAPRKWVPGTIMAFAGTPKDQERANLIAYLNSKSDNPLPLPPVTAGSGEADAGADAAAADDSANPGAATGKTGPAGDANAKKPATDAQEAPAGGESKTDKAETQGTANTDREAGKIKQDTGEGKPNDKAPHTKDAPAEQKETTTAKPVGNAAASDESTKTAPAAH